MDRSRSGKLPVRVRLLRPSFSRYLDRVEQTSRVLEPRPADAGHDAASHPLLERQRAGFVGPERERD